MHSCGVLEHACICWCPLLCALVRSCGILKCTSKSRCLLLCALVHSCGVLEHAWCTLVSALLHSFTLLSAHAFSSARVTVGFALLCCCRARICWCSLWCALVRSCGILVRTCVYWCALLWRSRARVFHARAKKSDKFDISRLCFHHDFLVGSLE